MPKNMAGFIFANDKITKLVDTIISRLNQGINMIWKTSLYTLCY